MKITVLFFSLLISVSLMAQNSGRFSEIKIKTSAQCEDCKERIEEALAFEKGIKRAELDMKTKIVTVIYRKGKTEPAKIRKAINKTGYDADDEAADPKAYRKLPACCKKPGDPNRVEHK